MKLLRRFHSRAETIESKAIDLFNEIEREFGEDSEEASFAAGAMCAARELRGALTPRDAPSNEESQTNGS